MTRKEQIIGILKRHEESCEDGSTMGIFENVLDKNDYTKWINVYSLIADEILAIPLKVPSDEEIMQKYPFWDEIDLVSNLDNQEGAKWMKEEIIKRNQP